MEVHIQLQQDIAHYYTGTLDFACMASKLRVDNDRHVQSSLLSTEWECRSDSIGCCFTASRSCAISRESVLNNAWCCAILSHERVADTDALRAFSMAH
ncbi:MAG: hypothetical protein ACSLEN_14845 [Candidatus Malihini olakiniferum]